MVAASQCFKYNANNAIDSFMILENDSGVDLEISISTAWSSADGRLWSLEESSSDLICTLLKVYLQETDF